MLLEDGVTVRLTMEGVDAANLSDYTLTVMGVQDTTVTGNYAKRNKFMLGFDIVGRWHFDDSGDAAADSSGNHSGGSLGRCGNYRGQIWQRHIDRCFGRNGTGGQHGFSAGRLYDCILDKGADLKRFQYPAGKGR